MSLRPMLTVFTVSVMSLWKWSNLCSVLVGDTICRSLKALYKLSRESSVFGVTGSEFVLSMVLTLTRMLVSFE